jgi:hypothetical protein
LVTIITPVLDRGSSIAACLASVAGQSYGNVEHIVVDGGSTDGTLDVLRSFSTDRSLRWVSGKDEGMYDAINKGIAMAEGEILAYLNSDDLYLPWSVEVAIEALEHGADLVYGDLGLIRRVDRAGSAFSLQFYPDFDIRYYTHTGTIAQPTAFWRKTLTDRIGTFDSGYRLIGDCEYWVRAASLGANVRHVDEVLALQIDHGETLRSTQPARMKEEFARMRAHYADAAPQPRFPSLRAFTRSARWRLYQWRFLVASARRDPKMWSRFIGFLRQNEIGVNRFSILVYYMLPGRLRPNDATWVDTTLLEEKVFQG